MVADNAEMMKECIERGFVDADCRMLMGGTFLEHCRKVAPKCAAALEAHARNTTAKPTTKVKP